MYSSYRIGSRSWRIRADADELSRALATMGSSSRLIPPKLSCRAVPPAASHASSGMPVFFWRACSPNIATSSALDLLFSCLRSSNWSDSERTTRRWPCAGVPWSETPCATCGATRVPGWSFRLASIEPMSLSALVALARTSARSCAVMVMSGCLLS